MKEFFHGSYTKLISLSTQSTSVVKLLLISLPFIHHSVLFSQNTNPIRLDSLQNHIEVLSSDKFEGRGTGSFGSELTTAYISSKLSRINLKPLGNHGTYFQNVPMHGAIPLGDSEFRLYSSDGVFDFQFEEDYLLPKSGQQTFLPQPVPLVFVGYGIVAPEFDYNDYQQVDVNGKVAVFLSGEPWSNDPEYFSGFNASIYSYLESKIRIAISRGALGSIMIPNPRSVMDFKWEKWRHEYAFEDVSLASSVSSHLNIILNPRASQRLFTYSKHSFSNILELEEKHALSSFPLSTKISFKGEFIEREFTEKNVIAILEGEDPILKDSYVLLSAHYDHLGIGPVIQGDSIYNGAFDNAAGVAAMLEIARVFSLSDFTHKRSLIFLFTCAEEKGLLGSTYYCDHPLKPLYKTIANINIDGLAMFDKFKDVVGIGSELSSLGEMLNVFCEQVNLRLSPLPTDFAASESFSRSDQIAFAKAGIPSILIMEGQRYENLSAEEGLLTQINWLKNYYHTPFDDLKQHIDWEAAQQHCELIVEFVKYLSNIEQTPKWNSNVIYKIARLRSIAENR